MEILSIDKTIETLRSIYNSDMEKLTYGQEFLQKIGYTKEILESSAKRNSQLAEWLEELKSYRDAEEQGLLLRLPVAIGSTIYHFEYPTKIDDDGTEWSILDKKRATIKPMKFALCHLDSIGKLYFLTKEEAEQALKQMGE